MSKKTISRYCPFKGEYDSKKHLVKEKEMPRNVRCGRIKCKESSGEVE
jgi:hypothetical protein